MYEIGLHPDHSIEEFTPPFELANRRPQDLGKRSLSPAFVQTMVGCVQSAHGLLDSFIALGSNDLRATNVITYVRMAYAVVMLIRMALRSNTAGSELARIVDTEGLRAHIYLEKLRLLLLEASMEGLCRVAAKFLGVVTHLQDWYHRHMSIPPLYDSEGEEEVLKPLTKLSINPSTRDTVQSLVKPTEKHAEVSKDRTQSSRPVIAGSNLSFVAWQPPIVVPPDGGNGGKRFHASPGVSTGETCSSSEASLLRGSGPTSWEHVPSDTGTSTFLSTSNPELDNVFAGDVNDWMMDQFTHADLDFSNLPEWMNLDA